MIYHRKYILIFGLFSAIFVLPVGATDSTSSIMIGTKNPNGILMIDSGYINDVPTPPPGQSLNFSTTMGRHCPANYKPYIAMELSRVSMGGTNLISGWGVCVNTVNDQGNNYAVWYLTTKRYSHIDTKEVASGRIGVYRCWGVGSCSWNPNSTDRLDVSHTAVWNSDGTDNQGAGAITWSVYCYPPGIAPPINVDPAPGFTFYYYGIVNHCWKGSDPYPPPT